MPRPTRSIPPEAVALAAKVAALKKSASELFNDLDQYTGELKKLVGTDNPVRIATGETVVITDTWSGKSKVWKQVPFDRYVVAVQAAPV